MDWRESRAGKRWLAMNGHRKKVRMTWLARARLLRGCSVREAADGLGLEPRTWEAWERAWNRRAPSGDAARRIWDEFGELDLYGSPFCTVSPATLEVIP